MKNQFMKNCLKTICLFVALLLLLCSCQGTQTSNDDAISDGSEVQSSESASSEEVSDDMSDSEMWKPDMGVFNEGKVKYEVVKTTDNREILPDELVGTVLDEGMSGVNVVLKTEFSGNDALLGGNAAANNGFAVGIQDGYLCIPYNKDAEVNPDPDSGWNTWSHNMPLTFEGNKQVQLSFKGHIGTNDPSVWSGLFLGCYVTDYTTHIPAWGGGDGLWFAFNPMSDLVAVFAPDISGWPSGIVNFALPDGSLGGEITMDVVCEADYTTTVFVTPENGERMVAVKVTFEGGTMNVFDSYGICVAEAQSTVDALDGGHYVFFPHNSGTLSVDELKLLEGSAVSSKTESEIVATPLGENKLGLDITDKSDLVSMCYSIWHDVIHGLGDDPIEDYYNISEILAGNQEWGPEHVFHYWAKPAIGYYRASDKKAIRNSMTLLYNAGVDFITVDLTHTSDSFVGSGANWVLHMESPITALLDTIMEMRSEGLGTPYVVLWYGESEGPLCEALYEQFYSKEKWQDCFVYWNGKPLILIRDYKLDRFPMKDTFTVRSMWGLVTDPEVGQWNCMSVDNKGSTSFDANGNPEQIAVVPACQETYMSEPTAHGRNHGIMWYEQWNNAFEARPKIVGVAWWNEWAAQRLPLEDGRCIFTDTYNQEYSRDIEPMEGGHGSQYYDWLCEYISAYKSHLDCPVLVEAGFEKQAAEAVK